MTDPIDLLFTALRARIEHADAKHGPITNYATVENATRSELREVWEALGECDEPHAMYEAIDVAVPTLRWWLTRVRGGAAE